MNMKNSQVEQKVRLSWKGQSYEIQGDGCDALHTVCKILPTIDVSLEHY